MGRKAQCFCSHRVHVTCRASKFLCSEVHSAVKETLIRCLTRTSVCCQYTAKHTWRWRQHQQETLQSVAGQRTLLFGSRAWALSESCRAREPIAGRLNRGMTATALGATPIRRQSRTPPVNQRAKVSPSVWFGSPDVPLNETSGEPKGSMRGTVTSLGPQGKRFGGLPETRIHQTDFTRANLEW